MKYDYPDDKREPYFEKGTLDIGPFIALLIAVPIFIQFIKSGYEPFSLAIYGCFVLSTIWECVKAMMIAAGKWKRKPRKTFSFFSAASKDKK